MPKNIAVFYDRCMLEHRPPSGHPERPERLASIVSRLEKQSLWNRLSHPSPVPITRHAIAAVHSDHMIDRAEKVSANGGGFLDHGDTAVSPGSWQAALTAASCACSAVDATLSGKYDASMALVRPPGHHATPTKSMGFCILNNVAIAAQHAIDAYGLERVFLIDFDVHHGNGTQDIFYDDPRVLFVSIHQHPAYPYTGGAREMGDGDGHGYNVNVPLPYGMGDDAYLNVFDEIVSPLADRYHPQLVLVSAGYDAHWRNAAYVQGIDERVTVDGFFAMSQRLKQISDKHCPGRLAGVLEGGYDLEALACGVENTLHAWLGEEHADDPIGPSPRVPLADRASDVVQAVRELHKL